MMERIREGRPRCMRIRTDNRCTRSRTCKLVGSVGCVEETGHALSWIGEGSAGTALDEALDEARAACCKGGGSISGTSHAAGVVGTSDSAAAEAGRHFLDAYSSDMVRASGVPGSASGAI